MAKIHTEGDLCRETEISLHNVGALQGCVGKNYDNPMLVKAMVFPVVMYGCESWTVKKAERRRIDAFELWCWRRLLRVPWTARRSNHSEDQPWEFFGRNDAKAETPVLWPPHAKS